MSIQRLLFASGVVAVTACGGGGGGGGIPSSPTPPPPPPSRDTYARVAFSGADLSVVDPAAAARLAVIEPAGSVLGSAVIYEADIDAATGETSNTAARYVIYVRQGRLFRYDLRDRVRPVQVSSATDICEIARVDDPIDIDRVGLLMYLAGANGVCNSRLVDDEIAFANAKMDATTPVRKFAGQSALALHDAQNRRIGWWVIQQTTVGGLAAYTYSYTNDDFATSAALVATVPGSSELAFEASGGLYFRANQISRFFNPTSRMIVDVPDVVGLPIGRDKDSVFVFSNSGDVLRFGSTGQGPETPVILGSVPAGYLRHWPRG
jgi:hypothetical protein